MELVVRHFSGNFRIVQGGGQRPAEALRFIAPGAARVFLEGDSRAVVALQQGGVLGLRPGGNENLYTLANALWRGEWHAVPAQPSARTGGGAGVASKAAIPTLSMLNAKSNHADEAPRPVYPRSPPEPPRDYKIVIEVAGRGGLTPLSLDARPPDALAPVKYISHTDSGVDAPRRTQLDLSGLAPVPHHLRLVIPMQGSSAMVLPLGKPCAPVERNTQKGQWENVLVPVLPLRHYNIPDPRLSATRPTRGWVYVYLNGHLWRELHVVNEYGALRDVDLGAWDGVGDRRVARGHYVSQVIVPYLVNGTVQTVDMIYSRHPFTWVALMKLGGLAPDDVRFTAAVKKKNAAIGVDDSLRKKWLQRVDLSSYDSGFNAKTGTLGPIADAQRPGKHQRDVFEPWRADPVPVVYLCDQSPDRKVIPAIYVPGIFGSRLDNLFGGDLGTYTWDPDDKSAITKAYAKSLLSAFMARDWTDSEINTKTNQMHHARAKVMDGYHPQGKHDVLEMMKKSGLFKRRLNEAGGPITEAEFAEEEYQRRARHGWHGALVDYALMLETIEATEDEHFIFVAWAVGVDWRGDLSAAAAHLSREIDRIQAVTNYPELNAQGLDYEAGTQKVLVVTHSQGSMIARYASEVLGKSAQIQGVVHLNQPTTGAPALYRRFVGGAGIERAPWYTISKLPDNVFSEILGTSSYHFTRMAGPMAGALSLLPTNHHVHRMGAKAAAWLECATAGFKPEVVNDIYDDIYLNDKVGLVCHKRYDAQGQPKPYTSREFEKDRNAMGYVNDYIRGRVDRVHTPENADRYLPEETAWHHDNMRLRPHGGMGNRNRKNAEIWFKEFKKTLRKAQSFHAVLGLKHHSHTWVIRSNGVATVAFVRLVLNNDKNGESILDSPYERSWEGDGTVPLTSQEILLQQGASQAGNILTEGHVVHADICKHPQAIEQTEAAICKSVESMRPKNHARLFVI